MEDLQKLSDAFSSKLEKLATGVDEGNNKFQKIEDELKSIKVKLETKTEKKEEDEDVDDYEKEFGVATPADVQKLVQKEVSKVREETRREQSYQNECSRFDRQAAEEIPELNHNKEFDAEVEKTLAKMPVIAVTTEGKKLFAPDALFNAAHIVASRWQRMGKLAQPSYENVDAGRFVPGGGQTGANENQLEIARRLGIKDDKAREIYKNWNQRKEAMMNRTRMASSMAKSAK